MYRERQEVAVRSCETVPMNSSAEWRTQFKECLIRTLKDALERRLNTRIRSSDTIFPWMVEWSAGLITRYVKGHTGRTAYGEARGRDVQAPVAEFGEKVMFMTSMETNKSAPKVDAKFHDGLWLGLRMQSDEWIIGTPKQTL